MNYRTYDDDFKREAVRRVIDNGEGLRQTSRDLGVKYSTLLNWVQAARKEAKTNAKIRHQGSSPIGHL